MEPGCPVPAARAVVASLVVVPVVVVPVVVPALMGLVAVASAATGSG